ncbi:MAG: heme exporter protein CcmB, partial [Acidobacteria bacterium]|nr:heme exporter protein CcmB [Acidobacteriota bacterium]
MPGFLRTVWIVLKKDLVVEARSRELVYTTVFFAVAVVLIFSFSFVVEGTPLTDAAAGILWVALAFAGTLALGRTFERERQSETLKALLLAPVERSALYVGKLLGMLAIMSMVVLVVGPLVVVLFRVSLEGVFWHLLALIVSGGIGFAAVGTLFGAMLNRSQSRDVLLPVVLYPLTVPVMIAGVSGTAALLSAEPNIARAEVWLSMLV